MQISELEQHEVQSCFEELLISQIGERVKEVKDYIEGDSMQKYAGLQLEGIIGGSSTSWRVEVDGVACILQQLEDFLQMFL